MATETVTWASVGSAGSWVASSGTLLACVQTEGNGTHGIEPTSTSAMFGVPADFTAGAGEIVNSVTIRAVMRVATAGDSCQVTNMLRVGGGSNVSHATTPTVDATTFTEYLWVWTTQPSGAAWTVAAANDIARCYVDPALSTLGGALHLDVIQVTLDYGSASEPPGSGTATGSLSWAGSATGHRAPKGSASGSYAYTGAATGQAPDVATASGSTSGVWGFTGSATGTRQPKGSGSGAFAFAGSAVGTSPTVDGATGTASGAWAYAGSATGARVSLGAATGLITYAGTAAGTTTRSGSAVGALVWLGAASGLSSDLVTPHERTRVIPAETRGLVVAAESRTTTVAAVSRTTEA